MRRRLHLREGQVKAVRKKVHRNGLNHSLYEGCEPFFRSILLYGVVWVAEVAHGIKSLAAARKIVLSRMKIILSRTIFRLAHKIRGFSGIQKSLAVLGTRLREAREMSGQGFIS